MASSEKAQPQERSRGEGPVDATRDAARPVVSAEFARAENEDDDGYDPWSDRPPTSEPLFERDPWG